MGPLSAILPVYRRSNFTMVRGEGVYLYSDEGRQYLDFASGIAVNSLGHCHPHLVEALQQQAQTLWHCSNMYRMPGLEKMASRLAARSFADRVFFCSSGAEAVETGIKMIRKYQHTSGDANRYRIITFEGGFHGRSLACISAGGNETARAGYEPLLEGFDRVAFNNLTAVEKAITPQTAGILVEPIQGEGGICEAMPDFLQGLRKLADKHDLLLFFDEVQCGVGRTGTVFAHELFGVTPDILSIAKGIGGGFPLGACLATARAASGMTQGTHGSTYGGNPLAMAVGNAVLDVMLSKNFLDNVAQMGTQLKRYLLEVMGSFPHIIKEIRGVGLMLGMEIRGDHYTFAQNLREAGLLTAPAVSGVIRILPPLIIGEPHVKEAMDILQRVCKEWKK